MIQLSIPVQNPYPVLIENGLLDRAGELLRSYSPAGEAALISDERVFALYGGRLTDALSRAGFRVHPFILPPGENSKSFSRYQEILFFLADRGQDRSCPVLALGGGVMGDVAGLAAATYLRGLPFVPIPSSLLAMADSCVGGKSAVNLPQGKNLIGAFHQPLAVLIDPLLLNTLPPAEIQNGMGEVIKTLFLGGKALWDTWEGQVETCSGEALIADCIRTKSRLIQGDEQDYGPRRLLNFGHSIGHAIEGASQYRISHGQAVAMGMAAAARASLKRGLCPSSCLQALESALASAHLDPNCPYAARDLLPFMQRDKKIQKGHLSLVIPRDIGHLTIETMPLDQLGGWLKDAGIS